LLRRKLLLGKDCQAVNNMLREKIKEFLSRIFLNVQELTGPIIVACQ
jgi:hypothetical protein